MSPLANSVSPVTAASAQELGTVIATLNDWRAILVVAFAFIGVLLVIEDALVFSVQTSRGQLLKEAVRITVAS